MKKILLTTIKIRDRGPTLLLLKFVGDEVERLVGLVDDQLFQEVLEELVDLLLLEVRLDLLHVVEFLQFVHFKIITQLNSNH